MKKKTYTEPLIEVIEIEIETPLLADSGGLGNPGEFPLAPDTNPLIP